MTEKQDDSLFEGIRRQLGTKQERRKLRLSQAVLALFLVLVVLLALVGPFVNWQWYLHDVRYPQVFEIAYTTRGTLFAPAFFAAWAALYFSLRAALGMSVVLGERPGDIQSQAALQVLTWLQDKGLGALRYAAPVIAFFYALNVAGHWNTYLLFRNAQSFGITDPMFGRDLGFFVFQLPFYQAMASTLLGFAALVTAATLAVYLGLLSLADAAKVELSRPQVRAHLGVLLGATFIFLGVSTYLHSFEVVYSVGAQFTGAGFAASQQTIATWILAGIMCLIGVATWLNIRVGTAYRAPVVGAASIAIFWLIAVQAYPAVVQRFLVAPQLTVKEAPFAERAIKMTRFGYGLDRIESRDFRVKEEPTVAQVSAAESTLENIRLWDPDILQSTFESLQGLRRYYAFDDVDVDRYEINGKKVMVMLAPRNINPDGLDPSAQNWNNIRLRYTHGYGVAMAQVNAFSPDGDPAFLIRDIPVVSPPELKIEQPRIYFSDRRGDFGTPIDGYVIVNAREPEISYQTGAVPVTHRWTGNRGIPLGGAFSRLALSIVLADANVLIAPNIGSDSRLLIRRNVTERARMVYPFLKFDMDPYLVIFQGRLKWILDGYTITDRIPYSAMAGTGDRTLNYIRNSVKVTIDAYTGQTKAYAVDEADPLLRAYRSMYPGLILDRSEVPEGLDRHFRYPEDLMLLQAQVLSAYHVQNPSVFLGNTDAWQVAFQRGAGGNKEMMRPYYVQMRLPDEPKKGFLQILPFTAMGKPNMSGWLAAHCDPGDYGRLTLYRFGTGAPIPGPEMMEGNFSSNPEISFINRTFSNEQSRIILGNILVVPIGESVMFVETMFLQSKTAGLLAYPRMFRIVLALKDRIVVGSTLEEALQKLFAGQPPRLLPAALAATPVQERTFEQNGTTSAGTLELFEQAEQALRQGDFARYGELQGRLRTALQELVEAEAQRASAAGNLPPVESR